MIMEEALLARAEEYAPLAALIENRVHWEERPQNGQLPSVTLQVISNPRDQHMKGFQSLQRTRVQADVWAEFYADKVAVTEALVGALIGRGTFHGIRFRRAMIAADSDRPAGGSKPNLLRRSIDFIIWHSPA